MSWRKLAITWTYESRMVLLILPTGPSFEKVWNRHERCLHGWVHHRQAHEHSTCKHDRSTTVTNLRISWTQQLSPERLPTQLLWLPLHLITMDIIFISHELGSHHHEECIEYIQGSLPLDRYQPAVKSSTEFNYFGWLPSCIEFFSGAFELLAFEWVEGPY